MRNAAASEGYSMDYRDPLSFDIDVDLSPLLDGANDAVLVSGHWYTLLRPHAERPAALQAKIEEGFRNALLAAQWFAAQRRRERRRAVRAPLLSRVHVDGDAPMVACDISLAGLRCSGRPRQERMDVEFRLPGLAFPVAARAEVVTFKDANVIPLAGLRFLDIDPPYLDHIHRYVAHKRARLMAA